MSTTKYLNASTPDDVVKLDSSGRLPAVDGSQLTGISGGGGGSAPVENLLFNPTFAQATDTGGAPGNSSTIQYKNEAAPGWHYIALGGQIQQRVIPYSSSVNEIDDIKYSSSSPGMYSDFFGQYLNYSGYDRYNTTPSVLYIEEAGLNNSSANLNRVLTLTTYIRRQELARALYGTPNAKSLTYSFWFKSQRTGTYIVEFCGPDNSTGSGGGGYYYSSGGSYYYYGEPSGAVRKISKSFSYTTAFTWQKISVTIPGITPTIDSTWDETTDLDSGDDANWEHGNMQVNLWLNCGTKYNSGSSLNSTWTCSESGPNDNTRCVGMTANPFGNKFWFARPQIEVGTSASAWTFNELTRFLAQQSMKYIGTEQYHHTVEAWKPSNSSALYLALNLFNVTKYLSDGHQWRPWDHTLLMAPLNGSGNTNFSLLHSSGTATNASKTGGFWTDDGMKSSEMHINGAITLNNTGSVNMSSTGTPYYIGKGGYCSTNYFETLR